MRARRRCSVGFCILGFVFLYAPIVSLVIFSFNESKLVTVWGGFSTKWYASCCGTRRSSAPPGSACRWRGDPRRSRWCSARSRPTCWPVSGASASRPLLTGMSSAPLVMPDVITGLSLLLLFVAMEQLIGWPAGRGMLTIIIAHVTFCMAYVDGGGAVAAGDLD